MAADYLLRALVVSEVVPVNKIVEEARNVIWVLGKKELGVLCKEH